jgi:branched-chain amino acid transport system substrate-binding protein
MGITEKSPDRPARRRLMNALSAGPLAMCLLATAACGGGGSGGSGAKPTADDMAAVLGPLSPAKGTPIKIGWIDDGKSAVSDASTQGRVAEATVKYINERKGGIAGHPIQLVKCETLADPATATDCGNRMVENKVAAVVGSQSGQGDAVWTPLHDAHIPLMFTAAGGGGLLSDKDSTFVLASPLFPLIDQPLELARKYGAKKVTEVVIDVPAATTVQKALAPSMFKDAGVDYRLLPIPPGTADMTAQLQHLVTDGTGLVHVMGTEAFCISAFNSLRAVGYSGKIAAFGDCITPATRKAVPAEVLNGMVISTTAPVETDNPSSRLYKAIVATYGKNIDLGFIPGVTGMVALLAFQAATAGITGDITPATVIAKIKSMPEMELPGEVGMKFRCNGKATPLMGAVCVRGGVSATLDAKGKPIAYETLGDTPIES